MRSRFNINERKTLTGSGGSVLRAEERTDVRTNCSGLALIVSFLSLVSTSRRIRHLTQHSHTEALSKAQYVFTMLLVFSPLSFSASTVFSSPPLHVLFRSFARVEANHGNFKNQRIDFYKLKALFHPQNFRHLFLCLHKHERGLNTSQILQRVWHILLFLICKHALILYIANRDSLRVPVHFVIRSGLLVVQSGSLHWMEP